jgi:hypothetical protein
MYLFRPILEYELEASLCASGTVLHASSSSSAEKAHVIHMEGARSPRQRKGSMTHHGDVPACCELEGG